MRRETAVLALACSAAGCVPPGISHGPRVREGIHVGATLARLPGDENRADVTGVVTLRVATENRRAGYRGRQFGLVIPVPLLRAAIEDSEPTALFLTGEYYEETDHPNSARVPRGWGIQGSLFSLAPYAKIGWYGERGGIHLTNGVGFYGGVLGVFPQPDAVVWWPSVTIEVLPHGRVSTALHLGGSLWFDIEDTRADYNFMVGVTAGLRVLN